MVDICDFGLCSDTLTVSLIFFALHKLLNILLKLILRSLLILLMVSLCDVKFICPGLRSAEIIRGAWNTNYEFIPALTCLTIAAINAFHLHNILLSVGQLCSKEYGIMAPLQSLVVLGSQLITGFSISLPYFCNVFIKGSMVSPLFGCDGFVCLCSELDCLAGSRELLVCMRLCCEGSPIAKLAWHT